MNKPLKIYQNFDKNERNEPQIPLIDCGELNRIDIEALIRDHSKFVMNFIRKRTWDDQSVDDIFQCTIVEALKTYRNFQGRSHPRTWLCGIAFNMIRAHAKKINIHTYDSLEDLNGNERAANYSLFGNEDPSAIYDRDARLNRIHEIFESLPHDMRTTFNEVVNNGLSYDDTAKKLGLPIGTVRSRIARARDIIRKQLNNH